MGKIFNDIIGQKGAIRILNAQLKSGNLGHAYIFLGNEGVGKEHLAMEFAQYILCPGGENDECPSCKNFMKGVHPDFIYVDGKEGIKIEKIRESIERINLSPSVGKKKVLFLSKAENLGIEAANALLKTLEEPPLDSIVIITAISEKSLPQTVISRCQKIKMTSLKTGDLRKILLKSFSEAEVDCVIDFCEGNLGDAKKLIENPEELKAKKENYDDIEVLLNSQSVIEKFKVIEKYDKEKNLRAFFDLFSGTVYESLGSMIKGEEPKIITISEKYNIEALTDIASKTLKIYENLEYNVSLKIAMEEIVLESIMETS